MTRIPRLVLLVAALLSASAADATARLDPAPMTPRPAVAVPTDAAPLILVQRRSCRAARNCREAVEMWCGGYHGADRDRDGIPCETVCRSRAQVNEIRAQIGC